MSVLFHRPDHDSPASPSQGSNAPGVASANPLEAILEVLARGRRFLVCSHARPDGDALGSILACGMLLQQMGKEADLVTTGQVPHLYRFLPGASSIRSAERVLGPYDAVILLECDGLERSGIEGLDHFFLINIDHHHSGCSYAHINWIDRTAPSVGEMVHRLAVAAGTRITPEMATCLYTTLLTDTGGFCYGSIQASTFELARSLVLAGANPVRIAQDVCFSAPFSKMLLHGAALNNLHRDGPLAWLWVSHQDMVRTCAADEDCEGIVNFAVGIAGVEAAVFLREIPDGQIRLSLRSKGRLSVAAIAEDMGGGGHQNAAGCTLSGPLPRALDQVLAALRNALAAPPSAPEGASSSR